MKKEMSVKKATLINGAGKYANIVFSFAVNIVLSRLLSPEEYGIVAVVSIFTTFFSIFSDMGFGSAYIENPKLNKDDRDHLFSFMCYVGFGLFVIFFGFSYFVAWFYKSDVYIHVCWLLGLNLFFSAVKAIPVSDLQRQNRFTLVSIVQIISSVISSIVAVVMAYFGCSYFSIVIQSILYTFINLIVFETYTKCKFSFHIHKDVIKKTKKFAIGQLGFNFINYFSRNIDNILISKVFGETELGYYDKAYKTSTYPVSNFASIIGGSIHPVLAKYQKDKEKVYKEFEKAFLFLFSFGLFVSLALFFSAKETILILYGSQWEESIVPFSFLALSLFIQMPNNIVGAFFQVLNKTKAMAIMGLCTSGISILFLSISIAFHSITAVSIAFLLGAFISFFIVLLFLRYVLFKIKLSSLWLHLARITSAGVISFVLCYFCFQSISIGNIYLSFFVKIIITLFFYLCFLFIFKEQDSIFGVIFGKNLKRDLTKGLLDNERKPR